MNSEWFILIETKAKVVLKDDIRKAAEYLISSAACFFILNVAAFWLLESWN